MYTVDSTGGPANLPRGGVDGFSPDCALVSGTNEGSYPVSWAWDRLPGIRYRDSHDA